MASLQLVESFPLETTLDQPDLPEAHTVWLELIRGAQSRLEFAEFYAANEPGSRLDAIVEAVEQAASRGVVVRFLLDGKLAHSYPATLARLQRKQGIEVRLFDGEALLGGVHHAKYFIVDDCDAFVGSQNFDWRSLTHIHELGLRLHHPAAVASLRQLFGHDWDLASGAAAHDAGAGAPAHRDPTGSAESPPFRISFAGEPARLRLLASPPAELPEGWSWDLPALVEWIDGARRSLHLQLLTFRAAGRDGADFPDLDAALRRAAQRGVEVKLLVSNWVLRPETLPGIQALQRVPGLEVRLVTIPEWSGGFVPFARVIHAKYMVVDARRVWLGTSNWERDYFYRSRNVSLLVGSAELGAKLDEVFRTVWTSAYARPVDPSAEYPPPRIAH